MKKVNDDGKKNWPYEWIDKISMIFITSGGKNVNLALKVHILV